MRKPGISCESGYSRIRVTRCHRADFANDYGLIREEGSRSAASLRLRHWGSEDYRPTLDAWREDGDQ